MRNDPETVDDLGTWLYNLRKRVDLLNRKYAVQRGALIPVLFTGSIDDLRVVSTVRRRERRSSAIPAPLSSSSSSSSTASVSSTSRSNRSIGTTTAIITNDSNNANANDSYDDNTVRRAADGTTSQPLSNRRTALLTRDLSTFDDLELNEWCKIFQEYWLTLQRTTRELLQRFEFGTRSSDDSIDPPASKSFLSLNNERYIALSLELIVRVFEDDQLLPDNENTTSLVADMVENVYKRLSFENRYLSKRIIERTEIIHPTKTVDKPSSLLR